MTRTHTAQTVTKSVMMVEMAWPQLLEVLTGELNLHTPIGNRFRLDDVAGSDSMPDSVDELLVRFYIRASAGLPNSQTHDLIDIQVVTSQGVAPLKRYEVTMFTPHTVLLRWSQAKPVFMSTLYKLGGEEIRRHLRDIQRDYRMLAAGQHVASDWWIFVCLVLGERQLPTVNIRSG